MKAALTDKVAIVTGASSGIGHAAARLFASEGARVVVTARRKAELDALVATIASAGGQAVAIVGDAADEAHVAATVALALERWGRLDVAFDNAGTLGELGPTTGLSVDAFRATVETNLVSAFLAAKHQIPAMLKGGSGGALLFTATFVGYSASFPGVAGYAASKAGLIGLVQTLAAEFGPQGIRVNALLPGAVDTPMYRAMNGTPESQQFITNLHALKRVATPDELARSALALLTDATSFMTGAAVLVDGGVSITRT
jgi:NAD(P)-dependent dehydrogenase (short-subunit alcohol dehydrogenase family)